MSELRAAHTGTEGSCKDCECRPGTTPSHHACTRKILHVHLEPASSTQAHVQSKYKLVTQEPLTVDRGNFKICSQ